MKVAIIGGHLSPALSVLDVLPQNWEVVFYGRKYSFEGDTTPSLEYQTMIKRGIAFIPVTTSRLQRRFTRHTIPSLYRFPKGYVKSLKSLKREKPDVVLSFGGYLSLPVCFAAKTLGIPVVLHEQTFAVGLANKIVSKFANRICISWQSSQKFFPKEKTVLTGNPLKKYDTKQIDFFPTDSELPILYVTGGSAGSHAVNSLVEGMLPDILQKFCVYHQTGDAKQFNDFDRLTKLHETFPPEFKKRYVLTKFVEPSAVGSLLDRAKIVLSRSGINTVSELLYFEKPSVLIPLPYGQKNEQLTNAQFLEKQGMAVVCSQYKTTSAELLRILATIEENYATYKTAATRSRHLIREDAATKIVEVLDDVSKAKITQKRQTTR